jgi:hypothetical protein
MTTTFGPLRRDDLDEAAHLFGACEESSRGVEEAREWLGELLEDPALVALVARRLGTLVGVGLASSTGWSRPGPAQRCELCLHPSHRALEPRLREALELALTAGSMQQNAA